MECIDKRVGEILFGVSNAEVIQIIKSAIRSVGNENKIKIGDLMTVLQHEMASIRSDSKVITVGESYQIIQEFKSKGFLEEFFTNNSVLYGITKQGDHALYH
jgi:hypothetical protein